MKFSVGYSVREENSLVDEIVRLKGGISEVYFSFLGMPSGRSEGVMQNSNLSPHEARDKMQDDILKMSRAGLKFNLLFNANCYGGRAESRALFSEIGDAIDYVSSHYSLSSVTTASPLVAKFVKQNFRGLDVRASVNLGIGNALSLEYVLEYFDSFYAKRELNRDINALTQLRSLADAYGKKMHILANSGCLNFCTAHTFHDNLVAHERKAGEMDNGYKFTGLCKEYFAKSPSGDKIIRATNFIRPEDTGLYENIAYSMKLATRVHENPSKILRAYIENGRFSGNSLSLLEPNHTSVLYPYILDNSKIKSKIENGALTYENLDAAFIKLEENYAYV